VSLATAIAIADVLESFLPDAAQLKWPNDVFVNGRKICGILVEAPPVRPARLVVGIGLNVNNSLRDAPDEIRARATSCIDQRGAELDREAVLDAVVSQSLQNIAALAQEFDLARLWSPRCLLAGRSVVIAAPHGEIAGECGGIDRDGALLVRSQRGIERLFAGVVKEW
jgi:BirA family biotin operon repressor/biotin-[acetyl-CoA-carboxylase] ligase